MQQVLGDVPPKINPALPLCQAKDDEVEFDVPGHIRERNRQLTDRLKDQLILAPLTKGGNLPFRRLCVDFGAEVTMSEMAFARMLVRCGGSWLIKITHARKLSGKQEMIKVQKHPTRVIFITMFELCVGCAVNN